MGIFRRKKAGASAPSPHAISLDFQVEPPTRPLVVDFGPRKTRHAGDLHNAWFVSQIHEPGVFVLDWCGGMRHRFECPPVDRIIETGGFLVGVEWEHAWGRDWGHSSLGQHEHAAGYDLTTGRELWRMEGGLAGIVGSRFAVGSDSRLPDDPLHVFDILTGKRLWSLKAYEPAMADDGDRLFVLKRDGVIQAHSIEDGAELWTCEPPDERRIKGNLCRVLVPTAEGLWYASHPEDERAVLTRLSLRDGSVREEIPFDGWVGNLTPFSNGLLIAHEFGFASLNNGKVEHLVENLPDAVYGASPAGIVGFARDAEILVWGTATPAWLRLTSGWRHLHVVGKWATLHQDNKILRWPLSFSPPRKSGSVEADVVKPDLAQETLETATVAFAGPAIVMVEHPSRGRFTLKVPDTGLEAGAEVSIGGFVAGPANTTIASVLEYQGAEGNKVRINVGSSDGGAGESSDTVKIGKLRRPAKAVISRTVKDLADLLAASGLLPELSAKSLQTTARRVFPDGVIGEEGPALLLQALHGEVDGLDRGFLSHDWRFGQETDDVIAEFAQCVDAKSIRFRQVGMKPDALIVSVELGGTTTEQRIDVSEQGLGAVATFLNEMLEKAGEQRRLYSLPTDGDWWAFLARTPDEVQVLTRCGLKGLQKL